MKTVGTILTATFILLPWCLAPLFSQVQSTVPEKKITITKRSVDAEGNEVTETIIRRGKAAENFDMDAFMKENEGGNVSVEIRDGEGAEANHIVIHQGEKDNFDFGFNGGQFLAATSCGEDKRAFLGVEQDSDEKADEAGLTVQVICGAAAEKAGLRNNDVILTLNDRTVNQWSDLSAFIAGSRAGDAVTVTYRRGAQTATAQVRLTTRSEVKCDREKRGFLGVSPGDDGDAADDKPGVRVNVVTGSAAQKAGLHDGDVILQLNDAAVADWEDISDVMSGTRPEERVRITYERDGQRQTVEASAGEPKKTETPKAPESSAKQKFDVPGPQTFNVREKEACLGVYAEDGDESGAGSRISGFTETSAAREADLQPADLITAINDIPIKSFDNLWNVVSRHQPGEAVRVAFLRDGRPMQVRATLKACKKSSSKVSLRKPEGAGDAYDREFTLFTTFDEDDREDLSERQVITIHREDIEKSDTPVANRDQPTPDRRLALDTFRAFPNPAAGQVTVEFSTEPVATIVSLFDLAGRQLFREELNSFSGEYSQQFDLSEYAKGTIMVQVLQGGKVFTEQIAIQ